jgi:hypothetical protein
VQEKWKRVLGDKNRRGHAFATSHYHSEANQ